MMSAARAGFWFAFVVAASRLSAQEEEMDDLEPRCGIFATQLSLASVGASATALNSVGRIPIGDSGVSMSALRRTVSDAGIPVCAANLSSPPALQFGRDSAVILLRLKNGQSHYVAVVDSDGVQAKVFDFPIDPFWISWKALAQELGWDGTALLFGRVAEVELEERSILSSVARMSAMLSGTFFLLCFFLRLLHSYRLRSKAARVATAGFTVVEVLVVLSVLSVLMALLLPAVQRAREASNQVTCRNRLRQIGIAAHAYASTHGQMFPPSFQPTIYPNGQITSNNLSFQAQLLPFLELADVYAKIDLREDGAGAQKDPPFSRWNSELLTFPVASFVCPSDSVPGGGVSYRGCAGSRPNNGVNREEKSFAGAGTGARLSRIVDGLSNTAYCSERVVGDRDPGNYDPTRDLAPGFRSVPLSPFVQMEQCRMTLVRPPSHQSWIGATWLLTDRRQNLYVHAFPPNSAVPDCNLVISARSFHNGGVNLLLCDGSTRFVSQSIDHNLWIALASFDGGESIGEF
jgi:prepilin-type N-terminal cleavage/methylation domain-containing protein/prepilin-type processing-associated H-X9-DG protein